MSTSDNLTVFLLFLIGIWLCYKFYRIKMSPMPSKRELKIKEIFLSLIIAFSFMIIRYFSGLLPTEIGKATILNNLCLAISAGAFASAAIIFLKLPEKIIQFETTEYLAIYTFEEGKEDGFLDMYVEVEYDRTNHNKEKKIGFKNVGFECCLHTEPYQFDGLRCANDRSDFHGTGTETRYYTLPHNEVANTILLDKKDKGYENAFIEPGRTKWFNWSGTLKVPEIYWDMLHGTTQFVGKLKLIVKNKVKNKDIAFLLMASGKETKFDSNLLADKNRKELQIEINVDTPSPIRCFLYWCNRKKIADEQKLYDDINKIIQLGI